MSLTEFGWTIDENNLTLDWDSQENVDAVKQRVASLIRGCKCRTGCGISRGCKKNAEVCSMGCKCINCLNTATPEPATNTSLLHLSLEEEIADNLTDEVGDIMGWVFGK